MSRSGAESARDSPPSSRHRLAAGGLVLGDLDPLLLRLAVVAGGEARMAEDLVEERVRLGGAAELLEHQRVAAARFLADHRALQDRLVLARGAVQVAHALVD